MRIIKIVEVDMCFNGMPPNYVPACYVALSDVLDDHNSEYDEHPSKYHVTKIFDGILMKEKAEEWVNLHREELETLPIKTLIELFKEPKPPKKKTLSFWQRMKNRWNASGCIAPDDPPDPETPGDD